MNILLIESLQKYHHYLGDDFKVEFPTGSSNLLNLWDVAAELNKRLVSLFTRDEQGNCPVFADREKFQKDLHFDHIHFHGDKGRGLGASHQAGWPGLVAKLIQQLGQHIKLANSLLANFATSCCKIKRQTLFDFGTLSSREFGFKVDHTGFKKDL